MKTQIAILLIFLSFGSTAMAEGLWAEYNIKKVQLEINHTHLKINELAELSAFVSKENLWKQINQHKNSMRESLASLEHSERRQLIKSYEQSNPSLASMLKKLGKN